MAFMGLVQSSSRPIEEIKEIKEEAEEVCVLCVCVYPPPILDFSCLSSAT